MVAPTESEKIASLPEMEPYMARRPFSKPICAHEERNGPPWDDQGLSTAKQKTGPLRIEPAIHAICGNHPLSHEMVSA